MKAANHELKSLVRFFDSEFTTPLMAIIDYLGMRLVAVSLLPIGKDSLVYGSNDGGFTIYNSDKFVDEKMNELASKLNLKAHYAGWTDAKLLCGPADMEIHRGITYFTSVKDSLLFARQRRSLLRTRLRETVPTVKSESSWPTKRVTII